MEERGGAVSDPGEVAELMFTCFKRARRLVDCRLAEEGLSLPRAKLLGALTEGACAQGVLAGNFDLAPRTITELVDGLVKQGLVERVPDPNDRRVRRVQLTEAGQDAQGRAWTARSEVMSKVFGSLEPDQLAALAAALKQIHAELDNH